MRSYNKFPTHKMSWYTRNVLLLTKNDGISQLFLLPMKRNDKLEQFCLLRITLLYTRLILLLMKVMEY